MRSRFRYAGNGLRPTLRRSGLPAGGKPVSGSAGWIPSSSSSHGSVRAICSASSNTRSLRFSVFRRVTLGLQQPDLFLELPDAPVQFVDVFRIAGYARFEGVDIALDSLGYALEVGCILHALQDSEARRPVGLRQFVKGARPLLTCNVPG